MGVEVWWPWLELELWIEPGLAWGQVCGWGQEKNWEVAREIHHRLVVTNILDTV